MYLFFERQKYTICYMRVPRIFRNSHNGSPEIEIPKSLICGQLHTELCQGRVNELGQRFVACNMRGNYVGSPVYQLRISTSSAYICGPGSSVGIATNYGLEGPGSNPGGDEIFLLFRPALGPTQPPVKRVPGLSWG